MTVEGRLGQRFFGLTKDLAKLRIAPRLWERLNAATDELKHAMGPNADLWQGGDNSRIK